MTFDDSACTLNIIEENQSVPEEEKQFQLFSAGKIFLQRSWKTSKRACFIQEEREDFFPIVFGGIPYSVP